MLELIWGLAYVSNSDTDAKNLLQLELNSALKFIDLGLHIIRVGDERREFASLVETRTQETWDLSDNSFRSKECAILLGHLLDDLLVLVDLLQVINGHVVKIKLLGLIDVDLISKNANLEVGLSWVWKLDCSRETLILLWIVVSETNLEFYGLNEWSFGFLGILNNFFNGCAKSVARNLGTKLN